MGFAVAALALSTLPPLGLWWLLDIIGFRATGIRENNAWIATRFVGLTLGPALLIAASRPSVFLLDNDWPRHWASWAALYLTTFGGLALAALGCILVKRLFVGAASANHN